MPKPPIGTALDAAHPLRANLTHFWPFWENSGTTVHDIVDATKNATIVGAQIVWATDAQGQIVLSSQGVTTNASQLQVPATVFGPAPVTMEFKVSEGSLNPGGTFHYSCIFTDGNRNGMNAWANGYSAYAMGGDSPAVVSHAATHHVFFVVGADGKVTWYIDGAKQANANVYTQRSLTRMMNDVNNERFMAKYEFVRLWNKALTDAEVASLYADPYQVFAASVTSVTVAPAVATVNAGAPQQFTATAHKSDSSTQDVTALATWSSSNPAIATVSATGVVTALANGTVTITATYSGFLGTSSVTAFVRSADGASLSPATLTLARGATGQLTCTIHFNDSTTEDHTASSVWSSSDENVATVNAVGMITAVGGGSAVITATFNGLSATADVTVTTPTIVTKPGGTHFPPLHWFSGQVSNVEVDRLQATITVVSDLYVLDVKMPRNVMQPSCRHQIYEAGCDVMKASYANPSSIGAGSTKLIVVVAGGLFGTDGYFNQGVIEFTTGANAGLKRTIKEHRDGKFFFHVALPFDVAEGDTFVAYPGCDKTLAMCAARFDNRLNFGGEPFIPVPETIL